MFFHVSTTVPFQAAIRLLFQDLSIILRVKVDFRPLVLNLKVGFMFDYTLCFYVQGSYLYSE